MRLATIKIPKGCTEMAVDLEDGKLIVSYSSSINEKEFFCKETCDFLIFWDKGKRDKAIVAGFEGSKSNGNYVSSDGGSYHFAIKFRNYEQYLKVKGSYAEDEP